MGYIPDGLSVEHIEGLYVVIDYRNMDDGDDDGLYALSLDSYELAVEAAVLWADNMGIWPAPNRRDFVMGILEGK